MKKFTAAILSMLLVFSMLSGCSTAELNYMNLSKEIATKVLEGDSAVTVELGDYVSAMTGIDEITVDSTYVVDGLEGYLSLSMDIAVDDKVLPNIALVANENNFFIEKDALLDIMAFYFTVYEENNEAYGYGLPEGYMEALEEKLADYSYIALYDEDTMAMLYGEAFVTGYCAQIQEIYELFYDYILDILSGFSSDIITQKGDTFTLYLDSEKTAQFVETLVEHLYENKGEIYDKSVALLMELNETCPTIFEDAGISGEDMLEEAKGGKESVLAQIDEAYASWQSFDGTQIQKIFADSYLENTMSKTNGGYTETSKAKLSLDLSDFLGMTGEETGMSSGIPKQPMDIFTIEGEGSCKEITGAYEKILIDEEKTLSADALNEMMRALTYELNPAQYMEISWWQYDYQIEDYYASVMIEQEDGAMTYDYVPYTMAIEKGRIYLPMRQICEYFGEEVAWDSVEKKALVIRGEEEFDLTGTIIDSRTYIKLRDFEKLGYTIDYVYEDGVHTAFVTKN